MAEVAMKDLELPETATDDAKTAHRVIVDFLKEKDLIHTGGCRAFYSAQEWKERGEKYGLNSVLIVCHDGGELHHVFNWDYAIENEYSYMEELRTRLGIAGFFFEQCTSWHSAVYKGTA